MRRIVRFVFVAFAVAVSGAQATTTTVTSNADSGAGTLRDAIASAGSGGTIDFAGDMTITIASTLVISQNITIDGSGHAVVLDGGRAVGVFAINSGATVQITQLTMQMGNAANGGAIYNAGTLTLTGSTVGPNGATSFGGGIFNSGTVTLTGDTLSQNTAYQGAGIFNSGTVMLTGDTLSQNTAYQGGGIYNNYGTVTLSGNTLSTNKATYGGGIFNNGGTSALINNTLSANYAYDGGGIMNYGPGAVMLLTNSTFSGNVGTTIGAGIYNFSGNSTLTNAIVADGCAVNLGTVIDNGGNLDSSASCGFSAATSQSNAVLNLGALADNGGPTQTILPDPGSAAINAVSCANAPLTDQRGYLRPDPASMGSATPCDAGAVEVDSQMSDRIFADGFGPPPVYK